MARTVLNPGYTHDGGGNTVYKAFNDLNTMLAEVYGVVDPDSKTLNADIISEKTAATGVTIDGIKLKDSIVYSDTIAEKTTAAGVTVDGVKLKDGCADFTSPTYRAIRIGTKGTTYANSTALPITSIGGTLDTDPASNYMVGVFTKVVGDEATGATDDLGSAWFRTRTDTGCTTPAGYSLYGVKSQLRIYSAASAGATSISNWAAAGLLGVLEVSGASTTFESGCIAAAVYGNVALGTGSEIASGAVVAAGAFISASSAITDTGAAYYGVYIGKSGAVAFDEGINIKDSSCLTGINIGTCTTAILKCTDDNTLVSDTDTHATAACDVANFVGYMTVIIGAATRYIWLSDNKPSAAEVGSFGA